MLIPELACFGRSSVTQSVYVQLLEFWPLANFHAQIWQVRKLARILETAAHGAKMSSISTLWGRKRVYMCKIWKFGHLPSFMPKYGNFVNGPVSWKLLPIKQVWAQFQAPGLEKEYMCHF